MTDAPPQDVMQRFGLTRVVPKAKTGIAQVWQMWRGKHSPAIYSHIVCAWWGRFSGFDVGSGAQGL